MILARKSRRPEVVVAWPSIDPGPASTSVVVISTHISSIADSTKTLPASAAAACPSTNRHHLLSAGTSVDDENAAAAAAARVRSNAHFT